MKKQPNDFINKVSTAESVHKLNDLILKMYPNMEARFFPIYVRYLKDGNLFGLLYFNRRDYFVLGIATQKKFSNNSSDASWMKYKEIKYAIDINSDANFEKTINEIKDNLDYKDE